MSAPGPVAPREVAEAAILALMRAEGLPEPAITAFLRAYGRLREGESGLIPESAIEPVTDLPDAEWLSPALAAIGHEALARTVVIKLNGGLGTSMGLDRAKSLLTVKEGLSFLDIIARQALAGPAPLVLMNSFATRADSLTVLARYPGLGRGLPFDFVQHKVPKIWVENLMPASWPADPELAWCPPGHGDLYTALVTSGLLAQMLERGFAYAFVSNADNLGAVLEPVLLGYFVQRGLPFLMEVADRTPADRKGGHLARRREGGLILREAAQCPPEDEAAFQDITRHRYFNTNNLWLDLRALAARLAATEGALDLPLIRNRKPIDPRDRSSPAVYQLETAMGAAIAAFPGAEAIRVPRHRFAPVKTTNDLLAVRSDAYVLTDDYRVVLNPVRPWPTPPVIELDPRFYALIDDFERRFPHGPPSLVACRRLRVVGDLRFGRGMVLRDEVELAHPGPEPYHLPDGAVLTGRVSL
ncbi:MAG: UTP--glucose-1-phosphate uridylyltransferase [Anaerolineae bacterium]|nr:UTP--glucose-1-phosphate uridylyltransferase [Caldilineales bacterium]MDW8269643.1 UTP--glucose-1-phosphate uridylyltransferase [Anaerolineae bacterium]